MAEIRDELFLDIDQAIGAIDRLENRITSSIGDVPVGVDLQVSQQELAATERQLSALEVDLDVDTDSFRDLDRVLDQIESDTRSIVEEVDRIANAADTSDDSFRRLADSLGVAEDEARDLADSVLATTRRADDAENAARDLARQLGLAEGETEDLVRAMRRTASETEDASNAAGRFRTSLSGLGGLLAGAVAGVSAFAAIRSGIEGATVALDQYASLSESVNAVNVVFEDSADTILRFGETAATSVGLANAEFNNLLVPIGAQLRNFGLDADDAANASIQLAERASDLASVYNTEVSVALEAIQSALRGEANPIERFGASVSAAAVESFALANGLAATKGEIDDTVKVQARLGVILRDTARVQGDFANTSDSVANAQRIIQAQFADTTANIGEGLLPAYEALLGIAPAVLETFENLVPVVSSLATSFAAGAEDGEGFIGLLAQIPPLLTGVQGGFGTLFDIVGGVGDIGSGFLGIFDALATGSLDPITDQLDDFGERFENTFERIAIQSFVQNVTDGVSEVNALGQSLLSLSGRATAPNALINSFDRLSTVAGLSATELELVLESLLAGDYDLTAAEIAFLSNELFRLGDGFDTAETARFTRQLDEARRAAADLAAETETAPTALEAFRDAADAAGLSLAEFAASTDPVAVALTNTLEPATQLRLRLEGIRSGAIDAAAVISNELGDAITSLPDLLRDANEDGQVSAEEFLANLEEQAVAIARFEANLALLQAAGQTALVNLIGQLDPTEAAVAAAGFVENLALAERAEDVLRGEDAEIARLVQDVFGDVTALADLDDEALELVQAYAAGIRSPEARDQIQDAIAFAALSAAQQLDILEIGIPVRFTAEGGFQLPTADQLERQITGNGGSTTAPESPTFSGTADRPIVNFNTEINNPVPSATEQEAATLEQQVGTAAALLSQ